MQTKPVEHRMVNLNIQGGESIYHPNIIEILEYARSKKAKYSDWNLNVSLITNAITGSTRWKKIVDLVDYFTISFHSEALDKQHEMFKRNVLYLKDLGKNFHVAVLMHPKHWNKCVEMVDWCKENSIRAVPRQLDHSWTEFRFNYNDSQVEYLTGMPKVPVTTKVISFFKNGINLSAQGRACCGGNTLCINGIDQVNYVKENNFKGWRCSVNQFFLYIRQSTGEVYTNKDCKMNFDGQVGPIGNLSDTEKLLEETRKNLGKDIICKKTTCWCGLCAPKAGDKSTYDTIMKQYLSITDQSLL
jgi:MoaA/NifB/PqqE/SkfB family radical SAM enzyme